MPYAVTLGLDGASAARIEALWRHLADAGLSQSMPRLGYTPHLTLAIADDIDLVAATDALSAFAATLRPLAIDFAGLACFPSETSVLWAAPAVTRDLLDAHGRLHEALGWKAHPHYGAGHWVPHCTLADDLAPPAAAHAMELLATSWQPFTARLDRLDLVRFRPVDILWRQTLVSGPQ